MSSCENRGSRLFATLLILMGALIFLQNVGLLPSLSLKAFWPVWMIVWGVFIIDRSRHRLAWISGLALIACGVLLTLGNLFALPVNPPGVIFSVLLIALGAALLLAPGELRAVREQMHARHLERRDLFRERVRERGGTARSYYGNSLHEDVVFSSINRRIESQQFEGGRLTAVFGSVEIDLTDAAITPNGATVRLKADAVFGGIEIRVPRTWKVDMKSTAVFGGCDDRSLPPRPELGIVPPTLVVAGSAVFGGISVRN